MNPQHKLGMLAMMAAAMSMYDSPSDIPKCTRQSEPEWKRKKCKSCVKFNEIKQPCWGVKPNSKACELYTKRK